MEQGGTKRRVAAVLFADAAGFGSLMEVDEEVALATLDAARSIFQARIERHGGRLVSSSGESLLAEFLSATDAVGGAVEVQHALAAHNARMPADRRLQFRIGVNVGDVVGDDDEAISGAGVDIAARLEQLAEPGGICIPRDVYNQTRGKLALNVTDLGNQRLKNIDTPVHVFRIELDTGPSDLPGAKFARDGQDMPSLAVLPFVTAQPDPDLAYVSEGISEELIGDLARVNGLIVVTRNSSFMFRDGAANPHSAAARLGVRYLLGGTVQPGDEVTIEATLIDAMTGEKIWSGSQSCGFPEIFKGLGKLAGEVAERLVGPPDAEWLARASRARAATPEAYEALLKGRELFGRMTPADDRAAREQFDRALGLDPACAEALGFLAMIHLLAYRKGREEDEAEACATCARAALGIDDDLAIAHHVLGYLQLYRKRFLQAQFHLSKAVALDGNDPVALSRMGLLNCYLGKSSEALDMFTQVARLNPCHAGRYLGLRAMALFVGRRYDEALEAFNLMPSPYYWERAFHAATLAMLGRIDSARQKLTEVIGIMPTFAVDRMAQAEPFQSPDDRHHFLEALRRAGLPG